jgi:hypothetical protein
MNVYFLKPGTLEHGPDLDKWPAAERNAAVLELYAADERVKHPQWMADALGQIVDSKTWRSVVLRALVDADGIEAQAVLRVALLDYPVSWLSEQAALYEHEWRAEDARERYVTHCEALADAAREAGPA